MKLLPQNLHWRNQKIIHDLEKKIINENVRGRQQADLSEPQKQQAITGHYRSNNHIMD